jgi:hypothetical protein
MTVRLTTILIAIGLAAILPACMSADHADNRPVEPAPAASVTSPAAAVGVLHYSADYTVADLLANDQAKAVLDKYLPGFSSNDRVSMAMGMTLKQVAGFPQAHIDRPKLKAINDDLSKIPAGAPPTSSASATP